jgi:hypothetical protein
MNNKIKLISLYIILLFFPCLVLAGDYGLYIIDTDEENCAPPVFSRSDSPWNPIRTPDEVIEDLHRYFSSEETEIKILRTAFVNGHVSFCTKASRRKVTDALLEILTWSDIAKIEDLYAFIEFKGSIYTLNIIDQMLSLKTNENYVVERLTKVRNGLAENLRHLGVLKK